MAGQSHRTCRFVSVICCAFPDGSEILARGECPGVLAEGPSGAGGFGYDPIFFLPQLGKTMAQLTPEEKNQILAPGPCPGGISDGMGETTQWN